MCQGPSTLVRMQVWVQEPAGGGGYKNPGSAPGTFGCMILGLYTHSTHGSSDCVHLGSFGSFLSLSGTPIPLQQFLGRVCKVQMSNLHVEVWLK